MKKVKLSLLIFLLSFLFIDIKVDVEAETASLSIDENDYELVCTYADGVEVTIARNDVYIQNVSNSISSSSSGIKFFLTDDQENDLYSSNGSVYRHSNITENGRCPSKLYVYDLPSNYDDTNDADDENVSTFYYSTEDGIQKKISGTHGCGFLWLGRCSDATQKKDLTTNLISEEVYLTTYKPTTVCDYVMKSDLAYTGSKTFSVFLYDNMTIVEVNGIFTTLEGNNTWTSCPEKAMYINDPTQKTVADRGNGLGAGTTYNYKRFYVSQSSTNCISYNDGISCEKYEYLGSRFDNSSYGSSDNPCEILGDNVVEQIKYIIGILQILVPVLTIVLTGFDIGKIVLTSNIEEELPKKKKTIIIRLIIMAFFFFLPLITNLLIDGLQDAGVIGIENIDCILDSDITEEDTSSLE